MPRVRHLTQEPLIPQDENLGVHKKKVDFSGNIKAFKTENKRAGGKLGSRKPLGDITNKASIHRESLSKKKDAAPKEQFKIAEEKFLHDHSKCIEAQEKSKMLSFWDLVLPGCDPKSALEVPDMKPGKVHQDQIFPNDCSYPEPVEINLLEFCDSPRDLTSYELHQPPMSLDSPPDFTFEWNLEPVEFTLKEEDGSSKEDCTKSSYDEECIL